MNIKSADEAIAHLMRDVYVRLGVTQYGVGVFAIRDIPAGVDPFQEKTLGLEYIRVPKERVDNNPDIPEGVRKFVADMCGDRDGMYNFPAAGMHAITMVPYLNHCSERPNVGIGGEVFFRTLRTIRAGEELRIDYRTFADTNDFLAEARLDEAGMGV